MKLLDIINRDAIDSALEAGTRDAAIGNLVDLLVKTGSIPADRRDECVKSVVKREKRGSTGFGHGVAVPHAKMPGLEQAVAALGNVPAGVDFNALDRGDVHSIVLLLSPEDQPESHLEAMEVIFGSLSQETFRKFLQQADSNEQIFTLLEEADASQLNT
ncbi:MAG: PTS sugar transporter subunit IIA [Phycisphaerales bacterium]|nr:PTS sugar transporter subunit IIA [Phycisphaerales bacterium]